jgi:ubiquinone biosynthesis protein UbiJ
MLIVLSLGNMSNMQLNPFLAFQQAFQARGAQLICATVNHLLSLEPSIQTHLKAHARRTVLVHWEALMLAPAGEQGFMIQADCSLLPSLEGNKDSPADVTVHLQAGLLQAAAAERLRFIRIEGDALLAQDLSLIAKQLRWDAEHDLARVIGDAPATWVVKNAKKTASLFEQAVEQFKTSASQAVIHYPGWAASAASIAQHQTELAALKLRIDAIELKTSSLKAKP